MEVFTNFFRQIRPWYLIPMGIAYTNGFFLASECSVHEVNAFLAKYHMQQRRLPDDDWYGKYAPNYEVIKRADLQRLYKEDGKEM